MNKHYYIYKGYDFSCSAKRIHFLEKNYIGEDCYNQKWGYFSNKSLIEDSIENEDWILIEKLKGNIMGNKIIIDIDKLTGNTGYNIVHNYYVNY